MQRPSKAQAEEPVAQCEDRVDQLAEDLAQGLVLAGQPLAPPYIVNMGWRVKQHFSEKQDPDRVKFPWSAPEFLQLKNPAEQRAKTEAEDIPIDRVCGKTAGSFAKVVHGVIDEGDCAELIACVNRKGFTPALLNVGGGSQMFMPEHRDGHRVIVDCPALTEWLLEVLRPHLPQQHCAAQLVELNDRCRFLCYTPGQFFTPHHDGRYARPPQHKNGGDFSMITLQVYLHDVPETSGGGTTFLSSEEDPVAVCQPGAGDVLMFTQDLYHEGSILTDGLKYTMRTEAMYRRHDRRS